MNERQHREFLKLAWRHGLFEGENSELTTEDGSHIEIITTGHPTPDGEAGFTNAQIDIIHAPDHRISLHGSIKIDPRSSHWREQGTMSHQRYDNVILHVVAHQDTILMRDNRRMPTLVIEPTHACGQLYDDLISSRVNCAQVCANLEPIHRHEILSRSMADRLHRKSGEIIELYRSCGSDWEQTAYVALIRSLGMGRTKEWYAALAMSLPIGHIRRCDGDCTRIQALLLGQAGVLNIGKQDPQTIILQDIYLHDRHELTLRPLSCDPTISGLRPTSHPTAQLLRISHVLTRLSKGGSLASQVIEAARTSIAALRTLLTPPISPDSGAVNISPQKIDLQIINFAIPFIVAYGRIHSHGELHDLAVELYESITAEDNTYTRHWAAHGVPSANAFDSQAIIQLATEFCSPKRCAECPLGTLQIVRSGRK